MDTTPIINDVNGKQENTLIENIELIVEALQKEGWGADFLTKHQTTLQNIGSKNNLSQIEAFFFAVFINNYYNNRMDIKDLSSVLNCKPIKILNYKDVINALIQKYLIRMHKTAGDPFFSISKEVISSVVNNTTYIHPSPVKKTIYDFFNAINQLFCERLLSEISYEQLEIEISKLVNNNSHLVFIKKLSLYSLFLEESNEILFIYMCHALVNEEEESVSMRDLNNIFGKMSFPYVKSTLKNQSHPLFKCNLIENEYDESFMDSNNYCLTNRAKKEFLSDFTIKQHTKTTNNTLLTYRKIVFKELYYNEIEEKQIQTIKQSLEPARLKAIQKRLVAQSMRKGINILFYGDSGTGKTETALQIAKQCKRDIMHIDISEMRSCWYGESEKKVKNVFNEYQNLIKTTKNIPILLFNEADAIISKRKENVKWSVDQTENTMQNIILEEMENSEGIIIATTNLINNIDSAFERRFLFKVNFEKPCLEAKIHIWNSFLQNCSSSKAFTKLTENDIVSIAENYHFSGGQIENIIRKASIGWIINNKFISKSYIEQLCNEELWVLKNTKKSIGFK